MATYNLNVTASVDLLGSDISGSQSTDFAIANPLPASSYFTFETVRNSDGFYDTSSPKNMAGTYTLGAGLAGLVKSDYIASVVVEPGGGTLTFVPTNYISGSSLNLRGTSATPLPVVNTFSGLLDTYSGAAAAYSLRLLSTSYTGSAIRVRRASDNTEQDIGFLNNELDTTSLASFCSGTDGFVTTWYDQSGNGYNATQTTAAYQPQIVSSGSVILNNSKPAIDCLNSKVLYTTTVNLGTTHSFFCVIDFNSIKKEFLGHYDLPRSWAFYQASGQYGASGAIGTSGDSLTMNQAIFGLHRNGQTGIKNYINLTQSGFDFSLPTNNDFLLSNLSGESGTYAFDGKMQEVVIYTSYKFSELNGIVSEINDFYSIY